jgi:hypothetical protein
LKAVLISERKQFLVGRQQWQHCANQPVHKMADAGQRRAQTICIYGYAHLLYFF